MKRVKIQPPHSQPSASLRSSQNQQPIVRDGTAKLRIFPIANIYAAGLLPLRVLRRIICSNSAICVN